MTVDNAKARRDLERRTVLLGAGAVGIAGVLAACGGDESGSADDPTGEPPGDSDAGTTGEPTDDEPTDDDPTDAAGEDESGGDGLVATSEVPVGGGVILADEDVVVTQPADGEFRGFSATCTHQGCTLADVADGVIQCECHGSRFSIEDGAVENGPATQPLPEVAINVESDQIVRA
jgi:Rieske Fe-S protein